MTTKFTNNAFATLSAGISNSTNTIQLTAGQGSRFPTLNSAAITVTIATPAVVTWTAHGLLPNQAVIFSTTGALPTGITAGTVYYVVGSSITSNTFQVSASVNGAAIATTGSQSGVHTGSSDWFWATLTNASNVLEIVRVVARSTDTITAFRGQDNSTANAYLANDRLELRPTAGAMNDKLDVNQANYAFAPLASPALTGVPIAPTASPATNTTQLATTAFATLQDSQNTFKVVTDTGAANAYVVAPSIPWTTYTAGYQLLITIGAGNTNTGASTLNVSGLGAKNILNEDGSALEANALLAGKIYHLVYDGTQFEIIGKNNTAPTPAVGDSSTKIATTAFVYMQVPAGSILHFAGSSVPTGWLACDGSAVSRTTYAALFAAVSTTWGVGDGSTTFNLPDLRGRALIGDGTGTGLTARTLGTQNIGEETHQLTATEMPSHTHTGGAHTHAVGSLGVQSVTNSAGSTMGVVQQTNSGNAGVFGLTGSMASGGAVATTSAGSDGAHNNMQPSAVVKHIIKY